MEENKLSEEQLNSIPINQCSFTISWVGRCKQSTLTDYCEKHRDLKCCNCGEKATHDCEETLGSFVCGFPLCNNCRHTTKEGEYNSFKHESINQEA